jgi:chorismate mutase
VKSSERKKQTALTWEIEVRDETIEELQAEIAALTAERNHLARELAARGSE